MDKFEVKDIVVSRTILGCYKNMKKDTNGMKLKMMVCGNLRNACVGAMDIYGEQMPKDLTTSNIYDEMTKAGAFEDVIKKLKRIGYSASI